MASHGYDSSSVWTHVEKDMCPEYKTDYVSFDDCDTQCLQDNKGNLKINGSIKSHLMDFFTQEQMFIKYWASAPAVRGISFSGSGMPWANPEMAFKNTPNKGILPLISGRWQMQLIMPNAFYRHLGKTYEPPQVYFCFINSNGDKIGDTHRIRIATGIPYRSLDWRMRNWNSGPLFYLNKQMPVVRTQEQILIDSSFPSNNKMANNFWGLKPPC